MAVGFVTLDDNNNLPDVVKTQFVGTIKAPTDGVTPALAAFQAQCDAAAGEPLTVPRGDCSFNGSLTGKLNLTFAPALASCRP